MNPEVLSLIGILIATAFFIFAIFRGYHVTVVSIIAAAIIALFSGVNIMTALTDSYMPRFAGAYSSYFLMFFFSALFAKSLGDVGAAQSIAFAMVRLARKFKGHEKLAGVLCLAVIQAVFSYGGISVFVVTFTVLYIAKDLFQELDIPWHLYTCGAIGSSTFTVAMLPGSPQLTNLVPMEFFGTDAMAAPVLGCICAVFCLTLCVSWVVFQLKRAEKSGEGFEPTGTALLQSWDKSKDVQRYDLPLLKCLFPSIVLFFVLNIVKAPAVVSLACATAVSYLIFEPKKILTHLKEGALTAVQNTNTALVALASATGFGGVVASVSGFDFIINALDKIPGPPVVQVIIAINVAAGFSASSSTGQRLALELLGDRFMYLGIPLPALHRLCAMSSVGLDTLPHSSALANTYAMCKLRYQDAYINNFMISVVFTLLTAIFGGILITLGLTF